MRVMTIFRSCGARADLTSSIGNVTLPRIVFARWGEIVFFASVSSGHTPRAKKREAVCG